MSNFTITTKVDIPVSRVADLVCVALEGGSTYWCTGFQPDEYPEGTTYGHEAVAHGASFRVWCDDEDDEVRHVDSSYTHIRDALQLMAQKFPRHWHDFMNENEDAITGDLFFQLLCFGEEVYG